MSEYVLTCDADPVDTLRASTDNSGVYVQVRRDERTTTTIFPTVEDTRTFARGLLALCDEAEVELLDEAEELPATPSGRRLPYDRDRTYAADNYAVQGAAVNNVTEPTRATLLHQARDLLAGQTFTADDLVLLAEYLAEEKR
ncbi:hypothetical protein ACFQ8W_00205 [Streptomyces sp. NPDC056508]|uniref:hypothetical protein n=1 Tax=Streptomyces sp. NPDC056508 TaxID=3345845 RepID=UPI00368BAEF8